MKEMGYVKKYICVGEQVPAPMVSYKEIVEKGDPTNVLVETAAASCEASNYFPSLEERG